MGNARNLGNLLNTDANIKAADLDVGQIGGRRNLIINGAMQVAQRSTSLTVNSAGYHAIDRMRYSEASLGTAAFTMEQSTDAPDGFGYSLKLTCTTAEGTVDAGDATRPIEYRIEGQDLQQLKWGTASAESLTLSFWVKSSVTGTYSVAFLTVQTGTNRLITSTYTINTANTWEYKTITIPGDTSYGFANDNTMGLDFFFCNGSGTNFTTTDSTSWMDYDSTGLHYGQGVNLQNTLNSTWQITGFQMEVGDTATPFEHRSYGEELRDCQRYYEKITDSNNGLRLNGIAWATTDTNIPVQFLVEKRAQPSASVVSVGQIYRGGAWRTPTGSAVTGTQVRGATISITDSSFTIENGYFIRNYVITADAEL